MCHVYAKDSPDQKPYGEQFDCCNVFFRGEKWKQMQLKRTHMHIKKRWNWILNKMTSQNNDRYTLWQSYFGSSLSELL